MRVMRRLILALLAVAATGAGAQSVDRTQVWINLGGYSHHFRQGDHREDNYGIGAEVIVAPKHAFIAGNFINSDRERSRYGGYQWRAWHWTPAGVNLSTGLVFALIDGYSNTNAGGWFPVVLPVLSAEYRLVGANLIFVPVSKNGAVLALQLKLRVW
jgi:hypothetical protein